jgi:hypothetical protein
MGSIVKIVVDPWEEVTNGTLISALVCMGILVLFLLVSEKGFVPVLDHANLAFHEAGHLFFGLLGSTAELYGGTLGQLFFPAVAVGSFWLRRQPVSFALAAAWFFENFFNIARYMADARARNLPLVGGGEHDWANIFSRWGALSYDTTVAGITNFVGWFGLLACATWLLWRWQTDRTKP